jgi:hypothetical protein
MAQQTNVIVKVTNYDNAPRQGVVVDLGNPGGGVIQSATTDGGGSALFTSLDANTYAITISGVATSYVVKNALPINPDQIPFENKTFVASHVSGTNILTQNQTVPVGTISGVTMAANVVTDFLGGVQHDSHVPSFYNPNTNVVVLWSGTNQGQQYDNAYYHKTADTTMVQSTTIRMNI